jgi:hypothetical protein
MMLRLWPVDLADRSWYTEHADIVPGHWLRFDDLMASQGDDADPADVFDAAMHAAMRWNS